VVAVRRGLRLRGLVRGLVGVPHVPIVMAMVCDLMKQHRGFVDLPAGPPPATTQFTEP
jgi:hypothetical protein